MERLCAVCGADFVARRSTAKYCSPKCRQRARRGAKRQTIEATDPTGLVDAVRVELVEADRLNTVSGQLAMELAKQVTAAGATGISSLSKELRVVMSEALRGVAPKPASSGSVVTEDQVERARKARDQKARQAARRA